MKPKMQNLNISKCNSGPRERRSPGHMAATTDPSIDANNGIPTISEPETIEQQIPQTLSTDEHLSNSNDKVNRISTHQKEMNHLFAEKVTVLNEILWETRPELNLIDIITRHNRHITRYVFTLK